MNSMSPQIEDLKQLAESAFDEDRMASVVELLKCYLDFHPDDGRAWFLYGDSQRILGIHGPAVVSLGNAERLCPSEYKWIVQSRLGMLFQTKGDCCTAERWFDKALQSEEAQQESWLWVLRGASFSVQGLIDEAEQCYRRAIAVNEKDEEAYLNLEGVQKGGLGKTFDHEVNHRDGDEGVIAFDGAFVGFCQAA